jgi:hypothetical protein
MYVGIIKSLVYIINHYIFHILIFDENHFSGTTKISKQIIDSYSSKNLIEKKIQLNK